MRIKTIVRFVIVVGVCYFLMGCSGGIRGTVTDKVDAQPIANATVILSLPGKTPVTSRTLSNGRFTLRNRGEKGDIARVEIKKEEYEGYSFYLSPDTQSYSIWLRPTVEETTKRVVQLLLRGAMTPSTNDETARKQEKEAYERAWYELWDIYLHPNYKAQYPYPSENNPLTVSWAFPDEMKKYEALYRSFYDYTQEESNDSVKNKSKRTPLTKDAEGEVVPEVASVSHNPRILEVQHFDRWRDEKQRKGYSGVYKVTVEYTVRDTEEKRKLDYYFVLYDKYWHLMWVGH